MEGELLVQCRKFRVVRKIVGQADGKGQAREYVVHPGAVVVLPLLDDGRVVMVRQTRPAIGVETLELPAGTRDVAEETAEACARRELQEETGYTATVMRPLCVLHPSPGVMSERIEAFVATGLRAGVARPEAAEDVRTEVVGYSEAVARVVRGEITDAKTMVTLLVHRMRTGAAG